MKIPVNDEGLPKAAHVTIDPAYERKPYCVSIYAHSATELAATLKETEAWVRRVLVPASTGEAEQEGIAAG